MSRHGDAVTLLVAVAMRSRDAQWQLARLDYAALPRAASQAIDDVLEFAHVIETVGLLTTLRALRVDDADELALAVRAERVPASAIFRAPPVPTLLARAIRGEAASPRPSRAGRALAAHAARHHATRATA